MRAHLRHQCFKSFFNGIKKFSIQWILTFAISFWKFGSPSKLQLTKWELTWEYEGSFLHTILHSHEHEMWLLGFTLGPHLRSPCFGHEPKVMVATIGAILAQILIFKIDQPIMYSSRLLNYSERTYTITKKEALAMVYDLHKYKHSMLGNKFTFYVDHMALVYLVNKP